MVEYYMCQEVTGAATETYTIRYRIPGEDHILSCRMYKWQAEWLLQHLQMCATVNPAFYPRAPRQEDSNGIDE